MYWKRFFTIGGWFTGLVTAALVVAAGTAAYAGYSSNQASKKAANQMRQGVETFEPIEPNAPQTVDWRREYVDSMKFAQNNFPYAANLGNMVNTFNTRQAQKMYRTFQPSFDSLQSQIGTNALSFARGELPADVVAQLGRNAAQRGLSGGFGQGFRGGGTNSALGNSLLRGLGLTSLDLAKFGTQTAMNASLQAKQLSPALFDPTTMLVNPQQAIGYAYQNAGIQNEAARYWNQVQNQALMGNVSAQNTANQNATNTELAGQLAQAQAIQQAGATVAGGMGQYATNQSYIPQGSGTYGAPAMAGAATPSAPAGYGYNGGGFYKLS